jgi:outer membrane protein TolC
VLLCGLPAAAQTVERLTFNEAIERATSRNPSVRQAASDILRAEATLMQVRSASLPTLEAGFVTNVIEPVTEFAGNSIVPRSQTTTSALLTAPLFAPVRWAERAQAADQVRVAETSSADVRRQIAIATAESYLSVIAARRQLQLNQEARDNARAHFEYADQRFQGGIGSRLNMLRAQQELSSDEARVETAELFVRRAQEALGVLVAADGPVDAAEDEPSFNVPPDLADVAGPISAAQIASRSDLLLVDERETAARRVVNDAWRSYLPSVTGLFTPQMLQPSGLFARPNSWRASFVLSVPVFDFGQRRGERRQAEAELLNIQAARNNIERTATSEVRTARQAIRLSQRALERAQAAVQQANEVIQITDVAFREGATTNIEVIDAQRRARDAETASAIAEDAVRRAQLDLLVAAGLFPR